VDNLPTETKPRNSGHPSERRDVRRAIEHWHRNTWGNDCIPFLDTFDFSKIRGDWGHRFLICGSHEAEDSVFVKYGSKLARLLSLPDAAQTNIPMIQQIPVPFREVFVEGYEKRTERRYL
jgi:hypothetical protein